MRRTLIVAATAMLALAAPALAAGPMRGTAGDDTITAAVKPTPTAAQLARSACRTEKHDMGTKLFKTTYAAKSTSKAMAACVAKAQPAAATELKNAAQTCKAERDANAAAFAVKYGTNENDKNALGKCVSMTSKDAVEETTEDRVDAAKTCKAARAASADAFAEAWGTKKNAFGKCVSATAKADDDDDDQA